MKHAAISFAFVLAFVGVACSSSTSAPTPADSGTPATPADSGPEGVDSGGGVDSGAEAASGKPATPEVVSVAPLSGGLHVTWKLNGTALTGVELWRKKDTGAYAKAYTLPGTATSQHDGAATAPGMYCYQVKTVRDSETSELSAEKCGTP